MLGVLVLFFAWPALDLYVSELFYNWETQRFIGLNPTMGKIRDGVEYFGWVVFPVVLIGLGIHWGLRGRMLHSRRGRIAVFLVVSALIGPALFVSIVLKEGWGRARPYQVEYFERFDRRFVPPLVITSECPRNCSFTSGDVALAAWFTAFAFVWPTARGRRRVFWAAVLFTVFASGMRIVMGKHFLSDTLFSFFFVFGINWACYHLIVGREGPALRRWWQRWLGPRAGLDHR
jgi:lipid A 4'-phosphatase